MKPLSLTLPMPPSMNSLWRSNRGRVHRSEEYRSWLTQAGWTIKEQKPAAIHGWVKVHIAAAIPSNRRDLDNLTQPLLNLITAHQLIDDDSKVAQIQSKWDRVIPDGQVVIEIRRAAAPAKRP
jgi:crossover junction endodeoxyribonuclease RusA